MDCKAQKSSAHQAELVNTKSNVLEANLGKHFRYVKSIINSGYFTKATYLVIEIGQTAEMSTSEEF